MILRIFLLCMFLLMAVHGIKAQTEKDRSRQVEVTLVNAVTGRGITDTICAEVLLPDSSVVGKGYSELDSKWEYRSMDEYKYHALVTFKAPGDNFIVRLSHPEYATEYMDVELPNVLTNIGTVKMRKLTRFEKNRMLGEVMVKASVIQVVNKGDTLQYNADAFALAEGSMLDALVDQLPGVELKDDGRIYVNGRFVDKLLLDGKDFFQGNQFVLLQNLPAYTIKNVKVYEKASRSKEVFGFSVPDDPDLYVMDVNLKKGYNIGWMANAEIGGGTHNRYRGRAFGLGYSRNFRLGAYGYINNMNEKRNPGRNGEWSPSDGVTGQTTSKAGGLSYNYYKPDNTIELEGEAIAQYVKDESHRLTNIQNFVSGGDTYTRRWDDNVNRTVSLNTNHYLTLRPKDLTSRQHSFYMTLDYERGKNTGNSTEGTFDRNIGTAPDLRESLNDGWVDGMGAMNRYLTEMEAYRNDLNARVGASTALSLFGTSQGLVLIGSATYRHSDTDGDNYNNYLVQYAGGKAEMRSRSNPRDMKGYDYNLAVQFVKELNTDFHMSARVDYFNTYEKNSNSWLTDERADSMDPTGSILPSTRAVRMMSVDVRNSYETNAHMATLRPRVSFGYSKDWNNDGQADRNLYTHITVDMNVKMNSLNYHGLTRSRVEKNYVIPTVRYGATYRFHRNMHKIGFTYNLRGNDINMLDLVDVTFDTDPLNLHTGNHDLSPSKVHDFGLNYSNSNWMFNRMRMNANLMYSIYQDEVAMSYSYDRLTGVKIYKPVNVNGNRMASFDIGSTIALDKAKRLLLEDRFEITKRRNVDMASYDDFTTTQKSEVNSTILSEYLGLQYSVKKFMAAIEGQVDTRKVSSGNGYFEPFRVTKFRYGIRGRVSLPAGFELSTDLKMYSNRGFDYGEMNTNQLVWNGRVSKSIMKGSLLLMLDGYDILGKVKNISYSVNEQGRTETWVNGIPSYVMLTVRWNFAKKPREN